MVSMANDSGKKYLVISVVALILLTSFYCYKSVDHAIHDFSNYYFAGKIFIEGSFDSSIYDPTTFNLKLADRGHKGHFVNFSPNSPFIALFFSPVASLDITLAKLIFNVINGFFFLFSFVRIVRFLKISNQISLLLIPIICFIPIRNGMLYGQFYLLLFSMLVEGYMLYKKGKIVPAMLLWVIPTSLKMAPGIVLFYLVSKRDYKSISFFLAMGLVVILLVGFAVGFDIFAFYLQYISPKVAFGEIVSAGFLTNQSPLMFFKHLFIADSVENPFPLIESGFLFAIGMAITYVLVLYFTLITSDGKASSKDFKTFGLWILLIFLISPYGSSYSRILLIIAYLSIIQTERVSKQLIIGVVLLMITNFPYSYLQNWPLLLKFPGFYATIIVFIAIGKIKPIPKSHFLPVGAALIFIVFYYFRIAERRQISSDYLMDKNPSLVLDYQVENDNIAYTFWHGKKYSDLTDLPGSRYDSSRVTVKNGQLYLGEKQLTKSPDNKRKPLLIDDDKVLFLSDWSRGYGFYALHIIPIKSETQD